MESLEGKNSNWNDEVFSEGTSGPGVSVAEMVENVSSLTVATIAGVAIVVLLTIAAVFLLGVLLDCRQQRLLARKMGEAKRLRHRRRAETDVEGDGACIAGNMEETAESCPPAHCTLPTIS